MNHETLQSWQVRRVLERIGRRAGPAPAAAGRGLRGRSPGLPRGHASPGRGARVGCRHSHGLEVVWSARHGVTSQLPELEPAAAIEPAAPCPPAEPGERPGPQHASSQYGETADDASPLQCAETITFVASAERGGPVQASGQERTDLPGYPYQAPGDRELNAAIAAAAALAGLARLGPGTGAGGGPGELAGGAGRNGVLDRLTGGPGGEYVLTHLAGAAGDAPGSRHGSDDEDDDGAFLEGEWMPASERSARGRYALVLAFIALGAVLVVAGAGFVIYLVGPGAAVAVIAVAVLGGGALALARMAGERRSR